LIYFLTNFVFNCLSDAPIYLGGTGKIDVDIGQNATLKCNWDSNPEPIIHWIYENNDRVLGVGSELQLTKIDQSYSGKYHCLAKTDKVDYSVNFMRY